tara:strand:+ start:332 stop:559 length:228 start_codon:yes stop_codon:yes gene_type:complete
MIKPTNNFNQLWNDLPFEERSRLMPHMIESQKLHIWQCKQKAIHAHNAHMKTLDDWLKSLDSELTKMAYEKQEKG